MRARGFKPSAFAFSGEASSTAEAPSETCDEVPAVWIAARHDRLERRELLERGLAQALVALHDARLAGRLALGVEHGCADRHDLAIEASLAPGAIGVLLAEETEAIGVLTRDPVLLGDALGALELRGRLVVLHVRRGQRRAALHVRAEGNARHHLDAAREHDVLDAGADHRGGERGRLLRRAALAVDRGRRDLHRQALSEPGDARDVERLLADLRDAAPTTWPTTAGSIPARSTAARCTAPRRSAG
jgi:hypothetical protein